MVFLALKLGGEVPEKTKKDELNLIILEQLGVMGGV